MDFSLFFSALMLGLAGTPHCAAMCGAGCAAVHGRGGASQAAFHLARAAGYAAVGALAAASVGTLRLWGQAAPLLHPLWTLMHCAALGLGLWLLATGRQPPFLQSLGRTANPSQGLPLRRLRAQGPAASALAGSLWVALPCGLLQSALVVAALAPTPASGAVVMAGFAATSALGLVLGPALVLRWAGGREAALRANTLALRLAGAALAGASAWALGHGLWQRALDYCFS